MLHLRLNIFTVRIYLIVLAVTDSDIFYYSRIKKIASYIDLKYVRNIYKMQAENMPSKYLYLGLPTFK